MSVQLAKLIMFDLDENVKRSTNVKNVKRNLFGTPKKDTLNRVLGDQEQSFNDTDRFIDKWGFDPSTGRPVNESKYAWETIKSTEVPAFYNKSYAQKLVNDSNCPRRQDTRQQRCCNISRPVASAKRKLDLNINDENQVREKDEDDRVSCKVCVSCLQFGLRPRSSSSGSLPEFVSVPNHDILNIHSTPTSAVTSSSPKNYQSAITDFLPNKKKRCISSPQAIKRT